MIRDREVNVRNPKNKNRLFNFTYSEFTATTIDNDAYGVRSGQRVNILYIRLYSGIPPSILGRYMTNTWMESLARLSRRIAINTDLRNAIRRFMERNY